MKKFKKAFDLFSSVFVAVFVLFAAFLVVSRLVGYRVFNVISGSMDPYYRVGDLIYVKEVDVSTIEVGTPITFLLNDNLTVATHRVVEIDTKNQLFYTKGDKNEIKDGSPVHFNNVVGIPQFRIPLLGYVSNFIQHPPGSYITIASCAILIAIVFIPDLFKKNGDI